ncbi:MAG: NADP-dependent malic enzyme [Clostridia bacterium]|nr:NADP-dependent malic enzyme [Clostridia bacterium]
MAEKTIAERSLEKHGEWKGKIHVVPAIPVDSREDLSLAYTPGVAQPCLEIQKNHDLSYDYTRRWNTIAVVTDGSAVLGLGDIGAVAGMPVMEGKCLLFSRFAGIDAIPICIDSRDPDEIIRTVQLIQDSFGGINLEDISAPRCFEIEQKLKETCHIPIFHDDQHGTAIVALAAVTNSLKLVNKEISKIKIVISGAGAAGTAIGNLLTLAGATNIIYVNSRGAISRDRTDLNSAQAKLAQTSNPENLSGSLGDVIKGADLFLGVSAPKILTKEMVKTMAKDAIVFAMANPTPEILPSEAEEAGAAVVGSGRSDFKNQINNLLAFPGVFRGTLDCRASDITEEMKLAAAYALASLAPAPLTKEAVLPDVFDQRVVGTVAKAVEEAARKCGVARK